MASDRFARFKRETAFIREYLWKYRRLVAVGLFSLVMVDILEIVPPILLKDAVDLITSPKGDPTITLRWLAAAYLGSAVLQGFCRYGWRMYLIRSSMYAGRDLRQRFTHHLFALSQSFFDRTPIGDLMAMATSDTEAVRMALGPGVLTFADSIFYFATVPIAMFALSPKLTLLAFIPLPIIPLIVIRNDREVHRRFQSVQEQLSRLSALAQEGLTGIRVVKAFAREDTQLRRFRETGARYAARAIHLSRVQTAFGPILDFTVSLGMVLLLYFGGKLLIFASGSNGAAVSLGTFVAFQRYIQKMVWPMAALGMAFSYFQRGATSTGRIQALLVKRTDVPDPREPKLPADYVPSGAWKTEGRVSFRDLTFRFPGAARDVLQGISLEIEPGERVAFIGTVGAGKSALLSLLPRLYPVTPGMLLVDGIDVNDWPIDELRRQVGYVSQEVFLFSDSVVENVAYGIAGWFESSQGFAPIEQATQLASVHEDVLGMVGAYETRLGERGVNLSGGQKQRLSIARALAKQPSILVLDDALSSVDAQTEEKILKGLRSRPGRNTEIVAAHRISTIRDADRIVVLSRGAIRQMGRHEELVRDRRGDYFKFYEEQRLKEDLEAYVGELDARA